MSCDVSVVIPTYNSSGTLKRALDSVYSQSLLPREIIVVDDGSDDWEQSRLIVSSCPDSVSTRLIRMATNQGVSSARNIGVSAALGRYLAFLDSDDVWYRDKLAIQCGLMSRCNLDFTMHQYRDDLNSSGNNAEGNHDMSPPPLSLLSPWTPLFRNDNTSTVMVLRASMVPYDASMRRGEDFILYMELLAKPGCRCMYIRSVLAGAFKSTLGVSGLSQDVRGMHLGRMIALRKLMDRGSIGIGQYLFGISTETMKYPIRFLRVALRTSLSAIPG
jgi:glycosyltransferase involved in cell wall biosynthesis